MQRLDPVCRELKSQMSNPELEHTARSELEQKMAAREELLLPVYHQVALRFADLHDTAGRMQEKGVITVRHTKIFISLYYDTKSTN